VPWKTGIRRRKERGLSTWLKRSGQKDDEGTEKIELVFVFLSVIIFKNIFNLEIY
jgi:antibiotic biosynthesis monooxygenase (ABM) superfamily enzyme